jgi:drug/metabolite transporter (DMT)-like permease
VRNWIVLAACLCLMVTAQILWKTALGRIGTIDVGSSGIVRQVGQLATNWRILAGLAIFGITTLLWLDLLSRMQLSLLYPMMSFSYVLSFFAGWAWLGEQPNGSRLLGIFVIGLGIFLVARTGK